MRYDEIGTDGGAIVVIVNMKQCLRTVHSKPNSDMAASAGVKGLGAVDPKVRDIMCSKHQSCVVRGAEEVSTRIDPRITVDVPVLSPEGTVGPE